MSLTEYSQTMQETLRKARGQAWYCRDVLLRQARMQMRLAALRWRRARQDGEPELAQMSLDIAVAYRHFLEQEATKSNGGKAA